MHGFAGIDLPGMGASPLHKDVLVMNLPYDNVPIDQVEKYMREEVVPFFARLPYTNLDGTKGFAIHWITRQPALPIKGNEGKGWGQIAGETFPQENIGIYHWMLVSGLGGGGQSGQLADAGSSGMGSWIHEFGHQLGLSHTGKWNAWSPTYTSLMNYSYSYGFEGDPKKVHFSSGELAGLVLNESHLPGKVPFPHRKTPVPERPALSPPPETRRQGFHLHRLGLDGSLLRPDRKGEHHVWLQRGRRRASAAERHAAVQLQRPVRADDGLPGLACRTSGQSLHGDRQPRSPRSEGPPP